MITKDLLPLKGIIIRDDSDKRELKIGASKEEIKKLLGNHISIQKGEYVNEDIYYYKNNFLQLSLINGETLGYIELFHDYTNNVSIDNINIFENNVDFVLEELLKKYGNFDEQFQGTSYINYESSIAFGRPLTPEDIEEDLGENDYEKGMKFSTVGIGAKGYFNI